IAADRRHIAYLPAGAGPDRVCDQGMISRHVRMGRHVAQPGKRPKREPSVDKFYMIQRQTRDVDDPCGRYHASLPQLEQVGSADAFDRGDRPPVIRSRERQTRLYPVALRQHGACTACSHVTALLGAGHAELVPENVQERVTGCRRELVIAAVDLERHTNGRTRRHGVLRKLSRWNGLSSSSRCRKSGWEARAGRLMLLLFPYNHRLHFAEGLVLS